MASRSDGHSNTDQHQDGKLDQESQHRLGQVSKPSEDDGMSQEEIERAIFKGRLIIVGIALVIVFLLLKALLT